MVNTTQRIPSLDGLRAISIVIVLISHVHLTYYPDQKLYASGNLGVRIFFCISGFLITSILISDFRDGKKGFLTKFYFRRAFRIFPPYLFFLAFMSLFVVFGSFRWTDLLPPLTYSSNYLFYLLPTELVHTWSLSVEEQFYLIFPVMLLLMGLKEYKKFLIFILLITPVVRVFIYTSSERDFYQLLSMAWNFHTNMDIIAAGCLLTMYRSELHDNKYYKKFLESRVYIVFLPALIFLLGYFAQDFLLYFYAFGLSATNILIALGIDWMVTNHKSAAGRFLNWRPICFIGAMSYSIYLWQQLFSLYDENKIWTYFPFNIILLCAFSLFSYYFVEKSFLVLRQKLEKKLFTEKPAQTILEPSLN